MEHLEECKQLISFCYFFTDLEIVRNGTRALFIFADDGTIVFPVSNNFDLSSSSVGQFLTWSKENIGRLVLKKTVFLRGRVRRILVISTKVDMVCFSPVGYGV